MVKIIEKAGSEAILIGGSTQVSEEILVECIDLIKSSCNLPVIIFPSNINTIAKNADAIFFMSLLNSSNPYYIIEAQMLAAPIIKKYNLETIPLAYLVIEEGGTVGYVGWARPLTSKQKEIILGYALAAEYLGMRFLYLEAGSGASQPIAPSLISYLREKITIPIIVGGGIKDYIKAKEIADAGANLIVTGTLLEEINNLDKIFQKLYLINENIKRKSK